MQVSKEPTAWTSEQMNDPCYFKILVQDYVMPHPDESMSALSLPLCERPTCGSGATAAWHHVVAHAFPMDIVIWNKYAGGEDVAGTG
jgi:hypothetical protein